MISVLHFEQAILPSLLILLAAALALPLLSRDSQAARTVALLITTLVGVRYLAWRWFETLPQFSFDPDSLWMWAFFIVEAIALINSWFTYLLLCRYVDRSPEATAGAKRLAEQSRFPSVDVVIATYNEGPEILERTIIGACGIDYPNFRVWVLDDGRRPWLQAMCQQLGVTHVVRPDNSHAKAGNINHALEQHCRGEFVLVLDADFVAHRQILRRTIGFFDDPQIGAVQTPQVYFNPDPIQNNLRAASSWVDEQRFFFDILQPAKDAWNSAFCCGTGAVLRRSALDAIGGFPTETVTEDIHVTYRLYEHGLITRYLNEPLNVGLAAEGLSEYLVQRSRWCLGTMQQLFLRSGPLGMNNQTLFQRMNYLSGALFWVLFIQKLLFLVAPVLFWFTGTATFIASLHDLLFYYFPVLLASWATLAWISRSSIFPLLTDASQLISAAVIVRTVGQALVRPFGRPFKVTPKGGERNQAVIHWSVAVPALGVALALAVGMILNTFPDHAVVDLEVRGINILWSLINIVMLILVLLLAIDLPRPRREERFAVNEPADLTIRGDMPQDAIIVDLSVGGAKLVFAGKIPDDAQLTINLPEIGAVQAEKTNGKDGPLYAVQFVDMTDDLRARLIRKLYANGYQGVTRVTRSAGVMGAILSRVLG